MRSSKQRSRSKQNRNRSVGNVVNRVFDSSGPEGKVRGTPQQIIDKYNQLARDAQLSGDRVATENFQQHAEHYTRMLAEAMREQEARREQQEQHQRERQQQRQSERGGDPRDQGDRSEQDAPRDSGAAPQPDPGAAPQPDVVEPAPVVTTGERSGDVMEVAAGEDSGLVETPESKPAPKRRGRPRKKPAPDTPGESAEAAE